MIRQWWTLVPPIVLGVVWLFPARAVPPRQDATPAPLPTVTLEPLFPSPSPTPPPPTPDETGAIVVIVQPGESLWVIAARAGLTLPELLALNNLSGATVINPGDALIIGYTTPAAPPPEQTTPTATPPPPTPRPTEASPTAALCLSAFDDRDRDGSHDPDEPLRGGVAFTVYNTEAVVANYVTDGLSEPKCITGLLPGEYRVTRSVLSNEVLTTSGDWALSLTDGGELRQAFGSFTSASTAQPSNPPISQSPTPSSATTPPSGSPTLSLPRLAAVLALFAGGLLLLGAVLILLLRQTRSRPVDSRPSDPGPERRFRDLDDLE